ncbi:hypothetical protein D3C83_08440 [compost metagenome]
MAGELMVAAAAGNEVGGDELRSLMQQLIERMLPVGAGCPEDDRCSGVIDFAPVASDALAIAFHFELLQVSRQALQPLIVR